MITVVRWQILTISLPDWVASKIKEWLVATAKIPKLAKTLKYVPPPIGSLPQISHKIIAKVPEVVTMAILVRYNALLRFM